jgi:hypothetical protein
MRRCWKCFAVLDKTSFCEDCRTYRYPDDISKEDKSLYFVKKTIYQFTEVGGLSLRVVEGDTVEIWNSDNHAITLLPAEVRGMLGAFADILGYKVVKDGE